MQIQRRQFLLLASAASLATLRRSRAQSAFSLTGDAVPVSHGFELALSYAVDFTDGVALYVQVADVHGPSAFFLWERLDEPTGTLHIPIGPYDVPPGLSAIASVVLPDGSRHPRSPVLPLDVPGVPDVMNA
jgi:hypothetical protein